MKTKITKYVLGGMIVVFGFLSWLAVDRAINVSSASTWLVPIIWTALFFVAISLGAVLIKEKKILMPVVIFSFGLNFIFIFSFLHLVVVLFSLVLISLAVERISSDIKLNIKLSLQKSIRTGKAILIVALAIIITSQYYFEIKDTNKANIIPKLKTDYAVSKIIPQFFPDLKESQEKDITVDEFILEMSKENSDAILSNVLDNKETAGIPAGIDKQKAMQIINDSNQSAILAQGRKNLEKISGTKLTGDEKISDVFSDIINNRIEQIFSPTLADSNSLVVPLLATLILFLTIISIGPFLGFLAIYLAVLIFWIMRKFNLVIVLKVMTEVERIE